MNNFKDTFSRITKICIIFYLFACVAEVYSQDKKLIISKPVLSKFSAQGNIYKESDKASVATSEKKVIHTKNKTSKTAKMAADTQPPALTCLPNKQLYCGSLVPNYLSELIVTDDSGGDIYLTQSTAGTKFYDGMTIVFTAEDEAGNKSSCSITISAISPDVTPPTFTCPTGLTLNCGDVLPNYATSPIMNLNDDCSIKLSYIMTPPPGTPFYDGIPVQIEYFDKPGNTGNRSVCNFTVSMATPDVTNPVFVYCPGTQSLPCGAVLPDYRTLITAKDNCFGNLTVSQSPDVGTAFTPGMTVTMTLRDAANNASTCSFVVNASADTTKPTITCPGNQSLSCGSVLPDYRSLVTATDNCTTNPTITQTPVAGSAFTSGMTVTMRATDASGNFQTCSFVVNASADITKPTITCPGNQSLSCGSALPDYRSLVTATDNCTTNPTITQTPVAGSAFTSGMTVTMRATDASGNFQTCSFVVNASADITKPTITCQGSQSLSCGSVLPDYRSLVTATDNCTSSPTVTQTPAAGSTFTSGMTVTMRATDASGNFQTCSFVVNASADTTKPTITCPGSQSLSCGSALPDYRSLITATDNCTSSPTVTQTPAAGSVFTSGMTVTMRATDATGNFQTCSFVVNASADTTKPTITCPGNQSLSCGSALPDYRSLVTATDNCTTNPTITQTPVAGSAFTSGMTVTMRATDASGNFQTCSFIVNAFADITKPTITCPGSQSLSCGSVLPDYRSLVTATDNCTTNPTITQTPVAGSAFTSGMTVTMRATDASGNFQTCSFVVNASADITKPTITCPETQTLALGSLLPDYKNLVTVIDDCTVNPIITQTPAAGSAFIGGINVTMRVTDASGNFSTCTFAVNATGSDLPPTITCPSNMELYANSTLPDYVSFLPTVTDDFTDGFDLVFTQTPPQGTLFTADTDVTITAKDASGNTASCTFLVKLKTAAASIDCKTTSFNVANLNGLNGFTIYGEKLTREAGFSVNNAGDVNGDGITDLIIGAPGDYNPWHGVKKEYKIIKGAAYVVFGKSSGFTPNIDLGLLNGSNGFAIRNDNPSTNFPVTGYDVSSAGDINGDGIGDFMVSDPYRHSSYGSEVGHTYVIFGKSSGFPAEFNLSALNGTNGFTLIGTTNYEDAGISIASVEDINGDGYHDIAAITGGSGGGKGKCYIVYGKSSGFPDVIRTNQLNGTNGFVIEGDNVTGEIGLSVAGLGDVNGDGISDMAIGSTNNTGQHRKYVIFGRSSNFPSIFSVSLLNGSNGFVVENSTTHLNYEGIKKAGDLNNDGLNDMAICGLHILFGKTVFPAVVDVNNLDGTNGFTINASGNKFGYAGDFNADGIDDYFYQSYSSTVVLFGRKNWAAVVNYSTSGKIEIYAPFISNNSANYAGDVNNDGISDLIIGYGPDSYGNNLKVNYNPGMSYVVFGKKTADTEKPVIANCPTNKVLGVGDPIPNYKTTVTITDNCDNAPVFTQTPTAGTIYTGGTQEIKLTATDANGNETVCTFNLMETLDDPPVMECPVNQELYASSMLPNYVRFLKTITDDTTQLNKLIFTQTPAAGTLFTSDTDVTITVKDKAGNTTSCTFTVKLKTGGFDIDCKTSTVNINQLNGINGFTILGEEPGSRAGFSTSRIGDVNGDGTADFIIGAPGDWGLGQAYVVFGTKTGFPASLNVANLNGLNGFKIIDSDLTPPRRTAFDVSDAGDINGDGVNDLMLSDPNKYTEAIFHAGRVYIIYGKTTAFPAQFDVSSLDGSNGFSILGKTKDEVFGYGIANVGDFNNDSFDDIGIVSHNEGSGNIKKCYILFGRSTNFPSVVDIESISSSNSFIVEGDIGKNLAGIGDVNGDGISDVAISGDNEFRYVVYGSASLPAKLSTTSLNGSNGFKIQNSATPLKTSYYFEIRSAGDINGDSYNDIGINNFILFGKNTSTPVVDLKDLDGTNGFKMNGSEFEYLHSYSSFGDFNKDGFDDYLLPYSSKIHVIYGKANWNPLLDIFSLDSSEGLVINTPYTSKYSLSYLGDVNGDAIDDIGIGSTKTVYDWKPNEDTGRIHVLYGKKAEDKEKPTIKKCPANQVLAVNDPIPDYTKIVEIKDNCDVSPIITQLPAAGTVFNGITQEVTITATDASGNIETCKFTIAATVIVDNEAPALICPLDQQLACGSTVPDYTTLVTVTDNSDPSPAVTQNPIAGSVFTDGMTITISAKDASNNESICIFKVNTEADVTKPVITCIGNQTLGSGSVLPDYSGLLTVTDNCDAAPVITQNPVAGSAFVDGMQVTMTAKDASNNESACSFIVNASADITKPVIACIGDQTLTCGGTVPDYTTMVTVTDNSDPSPAVTQNPIAGSVFTDGMTITISAKDASNNESTCSFKVNTESDITKPVITCIGSQSLSCSSVLPDYTQMITATDNCDPSPVITQNPLPGTPFTNGMAVTILAKDAADNESVCSFTINLAPDNTKPVISCISNQTVAANAILSDYRSQVTVTDNCGSNPTVIQTPAAGVAVSDGMIVQMSVSDDSGNTSSCSFIINTIADPDIQAPVITCLLNQKVTCNISKVPDFTTKVLVTDNKDPKPAIKQSPPAGSVFTDGMTITITATDVSSNKAECSFNVDSDVVLVDAGNDVEIKQGELIQLEATATEEGTFKWSPAKGVSNASVFNPFFNPDITTTYTVSFTTKEGCEVHDSVIISVEPKEKDETRYGFSPNNDGINDFWLIDGIAKYPINEVLIYNSWGDLVFQTTGYNNTTNVFSGLANKKRKIGADELPEGTYFFEIKPNSVTHHFKKLKGYLVLKR
ncbi:HYR domain-containing protein [Flavobacterium fluviatile]|uniref:HYR domain-containing protein n=1 Tax=Flavobacterium fluviatile TaxID=1862387 RepID=UPI0013D306BD|nr:HYR domain-containing protein [Flavobacterium fluviatile]